MVCKRVLILWLIYVSSPLFAQPALRPLPQHNSYHSGVIKPNTVLQQQMDHKVRDFYTQWKARFVKNVPEKNESYIWFQNVGNKQCVSEGQGYGMEITVFMAGYDTNAHHTFDHLFRYYRSHPSNKNKYLMAWAQTPAGTDVDKTSATDGDVDIAYSLLLASRQWGDAGLINYLKEAKAMISAIMQYEINRQTWTVLLSDAVEGDSRDYFATRSSDFMPTHFKAFERATHDERWLKVVDAGYRLFAAMQSNYSPDAGLLPDFIIDVHKKPEPAHPYFLESKYDGYYNYNACRVPWRIATDYLLTGDLRSKLIVDKINRWIRATTNNNTYNLSAGYTLAGNDLPHRYFEALSFIAPFGVSAMVDGKNQQWLNSIWNYLNSFKLKDFDYYDNSIKLLNMIVLSGNYWDY